MLGQILLTATVILIAYLVIRGRRPQDPGETAESTPRPGMPPDFLRKLAYGLVGLILLGGAYALLEQWREARERVTVAVINTQSGQTIEFHARRGDVKGRTFVTLDGQRVTLAEVERMVLRAPDSK